jgi:hypothetical protein
MANRGDFDVLSVIQERSDTTMLSDSDSGYGSDCNSDKKRIVRKSKSRYFKRTQTKVIEFGIQTETTREVSRKESISVDTQTDCYIQTNSCTQTDNLIKTQKDTQTQKSNKPNKTSESIETQTDNIIIDNKEFKEKTSQTFIVKKILHNSSTQTDPKKSKTFIVQTDLLASQIIETKSNAIEKKIQEAEKKKEHIEDQFTLVCKNKSYAAAIINKTTESEQKTCSKNENMQLVIAKTEKKEEVSSSTTENVIITRSRPSNPTLFKTNNGNTIIVPILDYDEINEFLDTFCCYHNISRGFYEYNSPRANTELKRAFETMKFLNITQNEIDSIMRHVRA